MTDDQPKHRRPRFWIILVAIVIALIFLYFYKPFQDYIAAAIPNVHFSNVLFWFASLVGVVAYAVAHWQSFRQNMFRAVTELDVEGLVYDHPPDHGPHGRHLRGRRHVAVGRDARRGT